MSPSEAALASATAERPCRAQCPLLAEGPHCWTPGLLRVGLLQEGPEQKVFFGAQKGYPESCTMAKVALQFQRLQSSTAACRSVSGTGGPSRPSQAGQ
ncbi:unnamed protein product [Rangifer tarandus platyrhynchus]|uniref:Uncharacterized protein n=1 Tax=Rangifer tarandus platyrhynchus TaxID=3082113 RepID=A0AC60A5G2_RANTA